MLTTFVVNLRHMLYSASFAAYLRRLSPAWKWVLAYLLTDEADTVLNYERSTNPANKHWYFLGANGGELIGDMNTGITDEEGLVFKRPLANPPAASSSGSAASSGR